MASGDPELDHILDSPGAFRSGHVDPGSYSRAPAYAPLQNSNNVNDSFGYLANAYGPGLVKAFAGPDAFLAHQVPGQALSDQYTSAQYQRSGVGAVNAAHQAGNDAVATRMMGIQSIMSGGKEPTQLDREQANTMASVVNNPVFKAVASQAIGPENLEGLMFGRRGDPAAIAAATNKIGFYRNDAATGGKRMSEKSLEQFSSQMYDNMYGKDANLDEMHGFSAGQTGEMMESMFQQGRLPKSMGAMSSAERVNVMSGAKRDDKTMSKLAEEFGHRDLMDKDMDYANATREEQKVMLADKKGGYEEKLKTTFGEIDKFKSGAKGAKSAEEIEQLEGFSSASNAVDAQRTSKVLKEYNGSVAAIREIFGDNGKSNTPMDALMKSLQHLTNGAQTSMSPAKVEGMVRNMRTAARDAGVSDKQLMQMTAEDKAYGQQIGLDEATIERGVSGRINMGDAMKDQGVFDKSGYGKLNSAKAQERQRTMSLRGDASAGGRSLAVLNRLAAENPEQFKGTELEAAAKAYKSGEETYTYQGKTKNLAELAGKQGVAGVYALAKSSGADAEQIQAYHQDKEGTAEYLKEGYAYKGQKYELQRTLSRRNENRMRTAMSGEDIKKLKPKGMSDEAFQSKNAALARGFSQEMTGIIMDETSDMTVEQRNAHVEKRGREELVDYFKSSAGGNLNEKQAKAQSDKYFNAMYGDDPKKRTAKLNAAYSEISGASSKRTGVNIEAQKQMYNEKVLEQASAKTATDEKRNERLKAVTSGNESTVVQRIGDELENLGSGDQVTASQAMKRVFNVVSEDSMLQKYAPEMQDALSKTAQMHSSATMTPAKIQALAAAAEKDPSGKESKRLMELAGYDKSKKLTEAERGTLAAKAMQRSAYTADGATPAEREKNEAKKQRADIMLRAYNTGAKDDVAAGSRALAKEILGPKADQKKLQAFADATMSADSGELEKQMTGGFFGQKFTDEQKDMARSVSRALKVSKETGGLEGGGVEQTQKSLDALRDRPMAKKLDFKKGISSKTYKDSESQLDSREYSKLKPADMSPEMFKNKGRDLLRATSESMASIATDEMGAAEKLKPEERADHIQRRTKEEMTKYFKATGLDDEKAEKQAEQHFGALFGKDKKTVQRKMEAVYTDSVAAAKKQGLDITAVKKPEDSAKAATPAAPGQKSKSDKEGAAEYLKEGYALKSQKYAALGVTKEVTPEQQKVIDRASQDPTGKALQEELNDPKSKDLLMSMPDKAAVDLFNRFDPAAQKAGLDKLRQGADAPGFMARNVGPGYSEKDQKNMDRLHTAITQSKAEKPEQPGGLSSQTVPPAAAQDVRLTGPARARGDISQTPDIMSSIGMSSIGGEDADQTGAEPESSDSLAQSPRYQTHARDMSRVSQSSAIAATLGPQTQQVNRGGSSDGGGQQGGGKSEMKLNGTLVLQGLQEAILQASGSRMEETPAGGVPIDMGGGGGNYNGR